MRPGREIDARVAQEIFGHKVWATNRTVFEEAPLGKRPLRTYSKDMEWAWDVAVKARITLVPIAGGQWFAFSAGHDGWETPRAFADFLAAGKFDGCGAALAENAAFAICEAALRAIDSRAASAANATADISVASEMDVAPESEPLH